MMKPIFTTWPAKQCAECNWISPGRYGNPPTDETVREYFALQQARLIAGTLHAFDIENQAGGDPATLCRWFHIAREAAPGIRLSSYDWPASPQNVNRDELIIYVRQGSAAPAELKQRVYDWCHPRIEAIKVLDAVCVDVYLLGPNCVARDLEYIRRGIVQFCHLKYPGKAVYLWVWGAYHPGPNNAWNPIGSIIPPAIQEQYADACWSSGADGVVVWTPPDRPTESDQLLATIRARRK
jgi:hypothetical protein